VTRKCGFKTFNSLAPPFQKRGSVTSRHYSALGADRRPFTGSTQAIADDVGTYAGLGVSELVFDFRAETLTESLDRMAHFAPLIKP